MSQHPTPTLQAQQNKTAGNSRHNTWTPKVCVQAMLSMEKQHTTEAQDRHGGILPNIVRLGIRC